MNSCVSISCTAWAIRFGRLARLLPLLALALVLVSNPELRAQDAVRFTYLTNQNAITITGYSGAGGTATIPATINGLPVTAVGAEAFYGRTGLTRVTLPDSASHPTRLYRLRTP